jgi:DNA invertase Pin-like site-specific DNA recombinase
MSLVITYERVSSDKQDITRQAQQRQRALATFPDAEHRVIQDDGVSAYKVPIFDRPGGAELCSLIESGEVEAIFTDAQDRLSRGRQSEWWNFWDLCESNGVRVFIDGRELRLDDEGDEMRSALAAMLARRESREKSHRTKSGMREKARQGHWTRHAPFGFRLVEHRLVPHPTEAEVVRRVFREYLGGHGITHITRNLRADAIKTRNGALLSGSRVGAILARREYVGDITDGDGEVLAGDAHEAIIDRDTFDAAQRLRQSRSKNMGAGSKRHLLQGLLRCSNGHAMLARGREDAYVCGVRHAYGSEACNCPQVSRRKVDQTIRDHFINRHWDEEEERARLTTIGREKATEAIALAAAADREESEAEAALARVRRDYTRGALTAEQWGELRTELEEEAAAARANADQMRSRAELVSVEVNEAQVEVELLSRFAAMVRVVHADEDDPETVASLRAALGTLFRRVNLSPGMAGWDDSTTYLSGQVDLVPVLHEDVATTRQGGGRVWGARPPRPTPVRTEHLRSRHG